ncbi:MAG: hypothetical protein JWM14_308 [Chitinophagaceae bacterium]|nr:hypothetical protein [Chitinophagaceae bacterium]
MVATEVDMAEVTVATTKKETKHKAMTNWL